MKKENPRITNFGIRRRCVVSLTIRLLPPANRILGTQWRGDCKGPRLGLDVVAKRTFSVARGTKS